MAKMKADKPIQQYAQEWQDNAQVDPLWVILTDSDKKQKKWDENDFFETGREEIRRFFDYLFRQRIELANVGRFLDFGCGVGRLSRALIERFDSGVGIDISPHMIDLANKYNAQDQKRIDFLVNQSADLSQIPSASVDFIYSHIVLQHMQPSLQRLFIAEFLRVLRPNGFAAFQVVTGQLPSFKSRVKNMLPPDLKETLLKLLGRKERGVVFEMNLLPESEIMTIANERRCSILAAPYTNSTDKAHGGKLEFFTKESAMERIRSAQTHSEYLSQFFIVRKP